MGFRFLLAFFVKGFDFLKPPIHFLSVGVAFALILNVFCICLLFCRKGSDFCAPARKGFGVLRRPWPLQAGIPCPEPKGSHFWANARQPQPRVRNFGKNLQRVRTFGHSFAKNSKGFALLTTIRKRFALLGIAGRNFERVRILRALASSYQNHKIEIIFFLVIFV